MGRPPLPPLRPLTGPAVVHSLGKNSSTPGIQMPSAAWRSTSRTATRGSGRLPATGSHTSPRARSGPAPEQHAQPEPTSCTRQGDALNGWPWPQVATLHCRRQCHRTASPWRLSREISARPEAGSGCCRPATLPAGSSAAGWPPAVQSPARVPDQGRNQDQEGPPRPEQPDYQSRAPPGQRCHHDRPEQKHHANAGSPG